MNARIVIDAEAFEAAADDPRFRPMNEAADRNLRELRSQGRFYPYDVNGDGTEVPVVAVYEGSERLRRWSWPVALGTLASIALIGFVVDRLVWLIVRAVGS